MSKEELKSKIAELKSQMSEVKGTPCEVFSRVVGYLRPVQSFNDGKVEEFRLRKLYNAGDGETKKTEDNIKHERVMETMTSIKQFRQCC